MRLEWDSSRVKTRKRVLERQPAHGGKACMLIKAEATMSLTGEKVNLCQKENYHQGLHMLAK